MNFLEIPERNLIQILNELGCSEILEKSKSIKTFEDNKLVSITWSWYDTLVVESDKIYVHPDLGSKYKILDIKTMDFYHKMYQIAHSY